MLKEEIDGMEIMNTDTEEKIESDPGEVYFSTLKYPGNGGGVERVKTAKTNGELPQGMKR